MPAPRAARLASRKSVIPDPDLYGNLSDDSDQDPVPPPSHRSSTKQQQTTTTTTSSNSSKAKSKPPPPVRGSTTTTNGRRRSTRISNESAQSNEEEGGGEKSRSDKSATTKPRSMEGSARVQGKQAAGKRKRVDKEESGEPEREGGEEDSARPRSTSAKPSSTGRAPGKRSKVDEVTIEEEAAEEEEETPFLTSQTSQQQRRTFVPRAAASQTTRVKKPPPRYTGALEGSDDDPEPFPFTTNPPTPHAAVSSSTGQTKRPATKTKQNPKGKAPRRDEELTPEDSTAPPIASTSRTTLTPPRAETSAALPTAETPVQIKNIAYRQGFGTPATAGRSARRTSARGSAGRGSSIGGGFEAVPHPQVADDKLYRSTDPDEPLAKRLRSIVSWASQRTRDRVFKRKSKEKEGTDALDEDEVIAKGIIDDFIADVCNLRVDTSIPFDDEDDDPANLPPHPQNISNAAKMKELGENYAAIDREQTLRQSLEPVYSSFFERRATSHTTLSDSSFLSRPIDLASLGRTLDLNRAGPTSLEEALEMGSRLLEAADAKKKEIEDKSETQKKDRRKSKAKVEEEDEDVPEDVLDLKVEQTLAGTAHLRHLTHKLSSFTRVASTYISHRSAETHHALSLHSHHGLESTSASNASSNERTGEPSSSKTASGLAAVGLVGGSTSSSSVGRTGGLDPMDLLRAIANADSKR